MAINFPNNPAVNDTFTVGGTTFTFTGAKWESSAVVNLSSDTTPSLGGTLEAGSHNINNVGVITATNVSVSSSVTAANLYGDGSGLTNIPSAQLTGALPELDGSSLTGLTGASAATYGNATAVPQIVVNSNGKITAISNVTISGGGGGGGSSLFIKDSGSVVGSAGTIDFGTNLDVSGISAGIVTVTAGINTAIINADTINSQTLSVSGVSTFAGITTITGQTLFSKQLSVSGISSIGGNIIVGHNPNTPGSGSIISAGSINLTGPNSTDSNSTAYQNIRLNRVGSNFRYDLEFHSNGYSSGDIGDFIFYKRLAQLGGGRTERMRLTGEAGNLTVTGSVTAASFSGDGIIPSGGIIIWSGAANAIPTGWYLCDGNNSTPDLRDRFVIGAGSNYAVDATGGSADATLVSHTHGSGNLGTGNAGSHSHSGNTNNTGDHSHSGNTNNTGDHQHRWGTDDNDGASGAGNPDANGGQAWKAWTDTQGAHSHNINTNNSGSHSHNINTNNTGDHSHNVSGDTASSGSSATGANLPPYYALCYIMKS